MTMNEVKWNKRPSPGEMVAYLIDSGASHRKLRLFAIACCRRSNQKYGNSAELAEEQNVIAVAEQFADGLTTKKKLASVCRCKVDADSGSRWIVAEPDAEDSATSYAQSDRMDCKQGEKAALLRDLFGNPFQPVAFDAAWRTPLVASLAQAAYEERILPRCELDPVRLTILADALEEAGCADETILTHLRSPGVHMRGCWAVDLCLGKE